MNYRYDANGNFSLGAGTGILAPRIIAQPQNQTASQGGIVTFKVNVEFSQGATFQWKFNGANITGAIGESLMLTNVSTADEGEYSVMVTNSAGTATSIPAELKLNGTTLFTNIKYQLTAYSDGGGSVNITPMKLNYDPGEVVTLTATIFGGNSFVKWEGDLISASNPTNNPTSYTIALTMDGDKTVKARFASVVSIPPGLVAFWPGIPVVSGTERLVKDLIGGHNGTYFSGLIPTSPKIRRGEVTIGLEFDGADHIQVLESPELKPEHITIEVWVLAPGLVINDETIIAQGSASGGALEKHAWWLYINTGYPTFESNHAGTVHAIAGGLQTIKSPMQVIWNEWTHLAATFDGSTQRLYVNGVEVAASHPPQNGGDLLGALIYDSAVPVTIGSNWVNGLATSYFNGLIDEVSIYNRSLTSIEIFSIYKADKKGKNILQPYFITPSPLPDAAIGVTYNQQLRTKLGIIPINFNLTAGALPTGINLSTTGELSGTISMPGVYDFTVRATDGAGMFSEKLFVLVVI